MGSSSAGEFLGARWGTVGLLRLHEENSPVAFHLQYDPQQTLHIYGRLFNAIYYTTMTRSVLKFPIRLLQDPYHGLELVWERSAVWNPGTIAAETAQSAPKQEDFTRW